MPRSHPADDLHGNAPDDCPVALLILDMINDFDFPGGDALLAAARPVARRIAALKRRAQAAGVPVVYVNDNFGRWRSDFREQVRHCLGDGVPGRSIVRLLEPDEKDYFVLKARHSGFFATPLELLLKHLGARTLVLTGVAGDSCVLLTASDAHLRDLRVLLPADAVASQSRAANRRSLEWLEGTLGLSVTRTGAIDFEALKDARA